MSGCPQTACVLCDFAPVLIVIFDQRSRLLGFAKETHIVQQSVGVATLRRKLYGKYCPEYVVLKIQKL